MKVEIEAPQPPKGYVIDGYRKARKSEHILSGGHWAPIEYDTDGECLVAVKAYEPPKAWGELFCGWLTRENGELWIHEDEPVWDDGEWMSEGEVFEIGLIQPNMQIPESIPDGLCCFYLGDAKKEAPIPAAKSPEKIEVGDVVKVVRKVESHSEGWGDEWQSEMDEFVGNAYVVKKVGRNGVATAWFNDWHFPQFALKKVDTFEIDGEEGRWFLLTAEDKQLEGDLINCMENEGSPGGWVTPYGLNYFSWIGSGHRIARKVK